MNKEISVSDLNSARDVIIGKHGEGSMMLGRNTISIPCEVISTGAVSLDSALGVWGLPRGRVVEIYGPESSGKTTLTLSVIAQAQSRGLVAAFIDAEHALDVDWAENIGVNIDKLLISQPDNGEQALDIVSALADTGKVGLIVVDSVAALTPRAELEGEMGDSHIGLQARLMGQGLRKIAGIVKRTNTLVVFINQIREKIGVFYGSNETTPGGRALKFWSSVRLDIRRIGSVKEKDKIIGNKTRVKVAKNKVAPPFKEAHFDIYFGDPVSGIDYYSTMIDIGDKCGVIKKGGSWYSYDDNKLGLGKIAAANYLRENTDTTNIIMDKIIETSKSNGIKK